jgi:hypothetical protein
VNNELQREDIWKLAAVTEHNVPSRDFPTETKENQQIKLSVMTASPERVLNQGPHEFRAELVSCSCILNTVDLG